MVARLFTPAGLGHNPAHMCDVERYSAAMPSSSHCGRGRRPRPSVMSIVDQVLHFIAEPDARAFEPLALAVFRYQYESVPAYGEYCRRREATPDSVATLTQIPPVSTLAFKYAAIENRNEGPSEPLLFLTSGTT